MRSVTEPMDYKLKTTIFAEIDITRPGEVRFMQLKKKECFVGKVQGQR